MYATKTVSSQTTSAWIPMDDNQAAFNASVAVTVSGTLTYSVEFTLDNVQDPTITPTAFSTTLTGATTSQSLAVHYPVKAFRLNVTAFTSGSATITVLQGSSWDGAATVGNSLRGELGAIYRPAPFPDFVPRLLASLVASSTAACTSGVVTVTAVAHGIIATQFNDFQFYYPGSANLAAGWYADFSRTGADTCTFSAPLAADFTSESINSGAAMVNEVTIASIVLPPYTLNPGDIVRAVFAINQDATSSNRTQRLKIGTTSISALAIATSTSSSIGSFAFSVISPNKQFGVSAKEQNSSATENYGTEDISTSLTISLTSQLASAGCYSAFSSLKLEIE